MYLLPYNYIKVNIGEIMFPHLADTVVSFLEKDSAKEIAVNVVGDVIFDEYYEVEVERISPEFPIPVYKSNSFDPTSGIIPGGAANVAYQFKHFNVHSELVALLSKHAEVVFNSKGINTTNSKIVSNITIPTKRRIYSHDIPLVRHDIEKDNYGLDDLKKHLFDLVLPDSDFTIFSDYSKGLFCVPWFRKFISKTKNIVDPKSNFIDLWEGCTYFKPNSFEAEKLSERKNVFDQIEFFMDALKCEGVLITQSGEGVVGRENSEDAFEVRPECKLSPADSVIGAGDCFIAFITMALSRGFSLQQAAKIGFVAGTAYVHKKHNSPLSPSELLNYIGIKEVKKPEILANRNYKLAWNNGCYDLIHSGHINALHYAKAQGDKWVVGLNSDESVKKLKGDSRPIMPYNQRYAMLEALECVDFIVKIEDETPLSLIQKIEPDVIVKSSDYKNKLVVGSDIVKDVRYAPMVSGISTSQIIEKIKNN
jgi:D-beta-D-heptose 7-phosphate kinase/D-beta-D-heptose 1-phosphate adenosyltransferase